MSHWLLYASNLKHGGVNILGVFDSEEAAWDHYSKAYEDADEYSYNRPHVECWQNELRVE